LTTDAGVPGSIPGHYKEKVVGLERGPLSLVSTTEELLGRKRILSAVIRIILIVILEPSYPTVISGTVDYIGTPNPTISRSQRKWT
jgi:hypothetical protein